MNTKLIDIVRYLPTHVKEQYPKRHPGDIELIAIHHEGDPNPETEATPWDLARWHVDGLDRAGICYHSVVTSDGLRWKTNLDSTIAQHVGSTHNPKAIGICGTGNFSEQPPTMEQMLGLVLEALRYCRAYPKAEVVGHNELGRTSCPGSLFDMDAFRQAITMIRETR